ncbi:hypothetical protein P9112_004490 [Eukaryota sp. TZLM1-RC]
MSSNDTLLEGGRNSAPPALASSAITRNISLLRQFQLNRKQQSEAEAQRSSQRQKLIDLKRAQTTTLLAQKGYQRRLLRQRRSEQVTCVALSAHDDVSSSRHFFQKARLKNAKDRSNHSKPALQPNPIQSTFNKKRSKPKTTLLTSIKSSPDSPPKSFYVHPSSYYSDLISFLLSAGWIAAKNQSSANLVFTGRRIDIDFNSVVDGQILNHFPNTFSITTKLELINTLKSSFWFGSHCSYFFPACFNLKEPADVDAFLIDFVSSRAVSILNSFVLDSESVCDSMLSTAFAFISSYCDFLELESHSTFPLEVLSQHDVDVLFEGKFSMDSFLKSLNLSEPNAICFTQSSIQSQHQVTISTVNSLLKRLSFSFPQLSIISTQSLYILKPGGKSRGRGIQVVRELEEMTKVIEGSCDSWIVQKYLERPLLINRKKFDIRQWVLVVNNPVFSIYLFGEFYVRLCGVDYDHLHLDNLVHLTNFAVQGSSNMCDSEDLIWSMDQLSEYFAGEEGLVEKFQSRMKEIVKATILPASEQLQGKGKVFEVFGFDFMIDQLFNVFLIECNSSPALSKSSSVLGRLIHEMMISTGQLVLGERQKKWIKVYSEQRQSLHSYFNIDSKSLVVEAKKCKQCK